ncbi:hypothetical protein [Shewanella sp. NIFS-20-20]|uniref:hypothetical protein n=1 Tax=Shewanella sp. NIFS-20-20 TaxID=2853806 RepID=UPI001C4869CD|nr:hypothetical protein [Shewanella sp. NIFS-20-20]MBV7315120.1 hypothetical protein [Shewanella sp. NIFS-20-20]
MNKLTYLVCILLLVGCGGGSESETVVIPDAAPVPESTGDLVAPVGFDFQPVKEQSLDVDISSYSTQRAFLSSYSQYHQLENCELLPVYDSRIIAMSLVNGTASSVFPFVNDEGPVLAEIWFYDVTPPIVQTFDRAADTWFW